MSLILTTHTSLLFKNNPNKSPSSSLPLLRSLKPQYYSLFSPHFPKQTTLKSPFLRFSSSSSSSSGNFPKPPYRKPPTTPGQTPADESVDDDKSDGAPTAFVDEWGEKAEPETETEQPTKFSDADPPQNEDEWGGKDEYVVTGNGTAVDLGGDDDGDKNGELKRCLVDTVYGTDLGFGASAEVRAEVLELVTQLEGVNPTPVPTDDVEVLDGKWVLLYTAFSELLPLLAAGSTPLLKVDKIYQAIDTSNLTIDNSITLSSPFATFLFTATANFEVRSPSRIQVEFKEGTLKPPEIKSSINLPENLDIFGQTINLSPLQQPLGPLQEAVASIARVISGQTPLKVPIPGERTKSWLLITYLDKDLRISRGDGGLFVLAKEGSPLLDQ
ncbi:hypothetical protein LguiA_015361 [Lonicera macranthoides]